MSEINTDFLSQNVLLLAPSIGMWRGQYQMPKGRTEVRLDHEALTDDGISSPRTRLLGEHCPVDSAGNAWQRRFRAVETALKQQVEAFSLPFPIRGVRIIPKRAAERFFEVVQGRVDSAGRAIRDYARPSDGQSVAWQLEILADEFSEAIHDVYRQMANHQPTIWEAIKDKVPKSSDKMKEKFHFDLLPIEIGGGSESPNRVTREDLTNYAGIVRATCQRKVAEAIETMVAAPRQQLADALAGLKDLIAREGRITSRSFAPVHDAIRKIRLFEFVADDDLLRQMQELEGQLSSTLPSDLRTATPEIIQGFQSALAAVADEVTDAQRQQEVVNRLGKAAFRQLDLD